ncbi:MAG: cysteine desulfurase [Opitutales bacterium]|nr:cysteine desulfurase [Opitutales bacterium]
MAFSVDDIRKDFPALQQRLEGGKLVYFDNAASAQKPLCVIEKAADFYRRDYSNIHRSAHELSRRATVAFEEARKCVSKHFNAPKNFTAVFTRGATEGLNIVARCYGEKFLKKGDEIILSQMEHHANIVPWQLCAMRTGAEIKAAKILPNGELDMGHLQSLVSPRTKIISIAHASNVLGTINDVQKISEIAKKAGAVFCVDAAQSSPHFLGDISEIGCDFFACSAHKCFGPTGEGALIANTEILNEMDVWQGGGDMIESVSWEKTTFRQAPEKFEAGTPNIAGAVAFARALQYMDSLDIPAARAHEAELLKRATELLEKIEGLRILGNAKNKVPLISFAVKNIHHNDISTMLDANGIAVRSGHHCAEPLMNALGVSGSCRASFAFYNTLEEVEFFAKKLRSAVNLLS